MVFSSRFGTKPYFQSDNSVFEQKKINYIKPEEWIPSSPDAAPMDYSIWGYLKQRLNRTNTKSLDEF